MKKKVLIADRCKFFRAELKKMLIELGHEVVAEVSTGSKVFLEYAATRPDLVILELIFLGDIYHRVFVFIQNKIHEQSSNSAVSVDKRVNPFKFSMKMRC